MSRRRRLLDAHLYWCTSATPGGRDLLDVVARAIAGGVDVVQLRDRSLSTIDELRLLERLRARCDQEGALLAVNDRADLAQACGADVLHTGQEDLPIEVVRGIVGPDTLLGRSTRGGDQAVSADADVDVDYFCVGPVWATPTKPGRAATGVSPVSEVAGRQPSTPWFAIGGIDTDTIDRVVDAGAERIVVVRAISEADDPEAAARTLRRAVARAERRDENGLSSPA